MESRALPPLRLWMSHYELCSQQHVSLDPLQEVEGGPQTVVVAHWVDVQFEGQRVQRNLETFTCERVVLSLSNHLSEWLCEESHLLLELELQRLC